MTTARKKLTTIEAIIAIRRGSSMVLGLNGRIADDRVKALEEIAEEYRELAKQEEGRERKA